MLVSYIYIHYIYVYAIVEIKSNHSNFFFLTIPHLEHLRCPSQRRRGDPTCPLFPWLYNTFLSRGNTNARILIIRASLSAISAPCFHRKVHTVQKKKSTFFGLLTYVNADTKRKKQSHNEDNERVRSTNQYN